MANRAGGIRGIAHRFGRGASNFCANVANAFSMVRPQWMPLYMHFGAIDGRAIVGRPR